jgi:hypothetical protein
MGKGGRGWGRGKGERGGEGKEGERERRGREGNLKNLLCPLGLNPAYATGKARRTLTGKRELDRNDHSIN